MITVKAYLYPNIVEVQVFDPTIFTTRNRVVYSRTIKVYQGIDNPIQVVIRNQDQKKVNLSTGNNPATPAYYIEAAIQDPVNQLTIVKYDVNFTDYTSGNGTFTIEKAVVSDLEQRLYKLTFSIENVDTGDKKPLYIDDNYGVPLDLMVLPAYWSDQAPALDIQESVVDGGVI
jgi:hypothetical protein